MIEELTITIPRTKGDAQEVAIYRALGSMTKLQTVRLSLDFPSSIPPDKNVLISNDPRFDELEAEPFSVGGTPIGRGLHDGRIRDDMINRAVDETLARSIFEMISSAKERSRYPVKHLELTSRHTLMFRIRNMYLMEFRLVQTLIEREWLLDRNPRDEIRNDILVTPRGSYYDATRGRTLPHRLDLGLEAVFRRVWPWRENNAGSG